MARRLRIGVDAIAFAVRRTGISNYIIELLIGLETVAPEAEFILYSNRPLAVDDLTRATVRVGGGQHQRGAVWRNTRLAAALARDRPDVFWGANGLLPLVRRPDLRTVVTIYDLVYLLAAETSPLINRLTRRLDQPFSVRVADRVVAISHATAADMARVYRRPADAVLPPVVGRAYGAVDATAVLAVRQKYALPPHYLLTLGTLEPRKNLVALVAAMRLTARRQVVPPLMIAGGRGWLDNEITGAIAVAEAEGAVRTLGYIEEADMPALYAGADHFVFASLYEGYGMPVVEAQLCGTTVLVSDIPALREASGGFATFFTPTVDGIADCLAALASGAVVPPVRPRSTIVNDRLAAATQMWSVMTAALG